jgi:hypothetical protein
MLDRDWTLDLLSGSLWFGVGCSQTTNKKRNDRNRVRQQSNTTNNTTNNRTNEWWA